MHRLVLQKETCLWVVNNIEQEHWGEREREGEKGEGETNVHKDRTATGDSVLELKR